jgi:hypothetical protein
LGHQIAQRRLCIAPNVAVLGQGGIFVDNEIGSIGQCQAIAEVEKCHYCWLFRDQYYVCLFLKIFKVKGKLDFFD